ncbi:MAG: phosphatidylserine decarboxylase family protein [Hyphomicrobiales bacterium]|nr:phosphatidylserine decarboxylase [Hyphomicrobiales bacterium]PCJ85832.1 MAG: phosphatidylserine decarboxylase family protein [Hyphomicrobiales bacterium]
MSTIVDSIRNSMVPIHKEGHRFIGIGLLLTLIFGAIWAPFFWVFLILTLWVVYFFRDPPRVTPIDERLVISPADGRISAIGQVVPPPELELGTQPLERISVFMNVFNCHVNRLPMSGQITRIAYTQGKFLNAELDKASEHNERNGLVVNTRYGKVGVVQIAGLIARRIVCWTKEGQDMTAGERFGLIRFGSRLDVYLPHGASIRVALGQTAIAGETVLAAFEEGGSNEFAARVD